MVGIVGGDVVNVVSGTQVVGIVGGDVLAGGAWWW